MQANQSDAFYLAQLLERLGGLESQLANRLNADAPLVIRTRHLLRELNQLLSQSDDVIQDMLEYNFMPKINRLLLEARQQLKLKNPSQRLGSTLAKQWQNQKKSQVPQLTHDPRKMPPPKPYKWADESAYPYPGPYQPIPTPLRDEDRSALIEDALTKLKMLLSDT